jgi:hypothetical protein
LPLEASIQAYGRCDLTFQIGVLRGGASFVVQAPGTESSEIPSSIA